MQFALTREISPAIARCELTHLERVAVDLHRARDQHAAYIERLHAHGRTVIALPADPESPDCVFVEDVAVVTDELAVITRPGAPSRRDEIVPVARALGYFRPLIPIVPPGTLDGGDVLRLGRTVLVGLTPRSNEHGIAQLRAALEPHGYSTHALRVDGCLHLKTAVTAIGDHALLYNPRWIDREALASVSPALAAFELVEVDPEEPFAANVLRLDDTLLVPAAHPRTRARLLARGLTCETVAADELAKAEGALTCCSILFTG